MRTLFIPMLVVVALGASGCATSLNRHASITQGPAPDGLVKVGVFATTPPSEARTVRGLDLSPEAQATLVGNMLAEGWSSDEVVTEMARVQTPREYAQRSDPLRRKVRFVLSFSMDPVWVADPANIADRIEDLQVALKPTNGEQFISWEQQVTAYASVNLGTQTDAATFSLGGSIVPDVGGSLTSLGLTPSVNRQRTTLQNLATRVVAANVLVSNGALTFSQTSAPNQDLVGNAVVDATLSLPGGQSTTVTGWRASDLVEARGEWADPARVSLRPIQIAVAKSPSRFCMRVDVSYRVRHVIEPEKARSVSEADDSVRRLAGAYVEVLPLAGADLTSMWSLETDNHVIVHVQGRAAGSQPVVLEFDSAASASALRSWMNATGATSTRDFLFVDDEGAALPAADWGVLQLKERKLAAVPSDGCAAP